MHFNYTIKYNINDVLYDYTDTISNENPIRKCNFTNFNRISSFEHYTFTLVGNKSVYSEINKNKRLEDLDAY